jgi:hypothetical protein
VEKSLNCSVLRPPYLAYIPFSIQALEGAKIPPSGRLKAVFFSNLFPQAVDDSQQCSTPALGV